jgi:hypothetical protein
MNSSSAKPTLISYVVVNNLLSQPDFFIAMPEFSVLQSKLQAAKTAIGKQSGCTSCKKKRIQQNMLIYFLDIATRLDTAAITRLKQFMKVDKLQYHGFNRTTGSYAFKEL